MSDFLYPILIMIKCDLVVKIHLGDDGLIILCDQQTLHFAPTNQMRNYTSSLCVPHSVLTRHKDDGLKRVLTREETYTRGGFTLSTRRRLTPILLWVNMGLIHMHHKNVKWRDQREKFQDIVSHQQGLQSCVLDKTPIFLGPD